MLTSSKNPSSNTNYWKALLFIVFISCLPLFPMLISTGIPHTSDGAMHAVRFVSFYKEIIQGQFPVRWVSQFHFGQGTALFDFVAPIPYLIGASLISVNLPVEQVLKISFAFTYLLSGIGMYLFAQKVFKNQYVALFVAVMYQFAPFRLVDMLIRGNIGSLYSYMLAPYSFYFIESFIQNRTRKNFVGIIIIIALLCLSHTIISYMFIGMNLLYVLFKINRQYIKRTIFIFIAVLWGLVLSSFYIIPAIIEHKYTNGYLFTKDLFYDHFPPLLNLLIPNFLNSPKLRVAEVSVQIGLFHVMSFVGVLVLLFLKKTSKKICRQSYFVIIVSVLTVLFMQPISKTIWENISIVRQFQFPWRFIATLTFILSYGSGIVLSETSLFKKNRFIYWITIILIIASTAYYWIPVMGYRRYSKAFFWNYPYTTNYHSEVNTIWMGKEPDRYPSNKIEVTSGQSTIKALSLSSTKHEYLIQSKQPSHIIDYTFFFPGWKVYVNDLQKEIQFQDPAYQGLITFDIPEGENKVVVIFEQSKIQQVGNVISFFSFLSLLVLIGYPKLLSRTKFLQTIKKHQIID